MRNGGNQTFFAVFLPWNTKKEDSPRHKKTRLFVAHSYLQYQKSMLHYTQTCISFFLFLNKCKKEPEAAAQQEDAGIAVLQPHF
jgi:hypothetical protein